MGRSQLFKGAAYVFDADAALEAHAKEVAAEAERRLRASGKWRPEKPKKRKWQLGGLNRGGGAGGAATAGC